MIFFKNKLAYLVNLIFQPILKKQETILIAIGNMLSTQKENIISKNLNDYEFKVFSQRGEDGIIQHLIKNVSIENETFIEFGVENYMESNTRFLLMNNNWRGFVIDGSSKAMESLKKREWFWAYQLEAKNAFITKENINQLMSESKFSDLGLLSIDIDGNDYWILEELDFSVLNPSILICEYNALFGSDRAISIPYDSSFYRTKAHYSNLYFGASLSALTYIANKKGYALIGCNKNGTNAFFVRRDLLNGMIQEKSIKEAFCEDYCRQSRDLNFNLSLVGGEDRIKMLKGLKVINVIDNSTEEL